MDYIADSSGDDRELKEEVTERLGALTAEKKVLADKMYELEAKMDLKKQDRLDVDLLISVLMFPKLYLPMMTRKEIREVMKGVISRVVVWDRDRVDIEIPVPAVTGAPAGGEFALRSVELPRLDALRTFGVLFCRSYQPGYELRPAVGQ